MGLDAGEQARLVRAAKRHIAFNLSGTLTIDALARALLTSRSRLCAAFRAETGESVGSYVRRMRIERACELLLIPRLSVAAVARAVGYTRTSSFTVAFERAQGCAPSVWRARRGVPDARSGCDENEERGAV